MKLPITYHSKIAEIGMKIGTEGVIRLQVNILKHLAKGMPEKYAYKSDGREMRYARVIYSSPVDTVSMYCVVIPMVKYRLGDTIVFV